MAGWPVLENEGRRRGLHLHDVRLDTTLGTAHVGGIYLPSVDV